MLGLASDAGGASAVTSASAITSPFLRELYAYWQRKAGSRQLPERSDIRPEEMGRWLGYLSLLDVVDDGQDCEYRLAGVRIVDACAREFVGRRISEIDWSGREGVIIAEYLDAARTASPSFGTSAFISNNDKYLLRPIPKLTLPLSADGSQVTKLLTCFDLNAIA